MKRPQASLTEESGTLPMGGSDPTEALPGAPGPRLVLSRYRLERRLGAGGFGVVWLAWDEKLEREVAVKVIPRENGGGERVENEARAAARLNHPGIVGIYELASDPDDVYLVSELVRGRTLAELLRARAIADRDVARIGMALCEALEHAHARGVIHRDVKPGNVMVLAEPAAGAGFAKLADFGVAHVVAGDPLTRTGDVVGTLAYMAPEQAEGARVTPACDVYSLALTLYEAWTGRNPVRAGGPAATARRLGRPLPSLAHSRRDLPLELCDAIDDALEIDPARRPGPAELRTELAGVVGELDAEGGLVEPETLRRVGLPTTTASRRSLWSRRSPDAEPREGRRPLRLPARLGAGLLAGAIVTGALETLGPEPAFSTLAAGAVIAAAVALLPRIAWLLTAAALCAWFVGPDGGDRQGTALILFAAALPIPLLLPRAGLLWSVPVLAPLLGTIALAPVFVGVAALAPTPARRAGAAAARLPLARARRAAERQEPPVRRARRRPAAPALGGLDQRRRVRCARAAGVRARAAARAGLGGLRTGAAAAASRPLARGGLPRRGALGGGSDRRTGGAGRRARRQHRARQRARRRGGLDRRRAARARGVSHAPARRVVATASRDYGVGLPC